MTSPILSTLFLGALCAHGATVYSNYTPGDPATYDPTRPISIVSSTALFDPTGYGAYVPGVHTDVLTVSYPVPTGLPNGITSFAVPIRIVTPGTNSSISFSLYRGSLAYWGFTLRDSDFILDGEFHEYQFDTTFQPNGLFGGGGYRIEVRLSHTPAADAEDVTMKIELAGANPADTNASATKSRTTIPTPEAVPAFFYGAPIPVPEPASSALAMLAALTLLRRKR